MRDLFSDYLDGAASCVVLAISERALPDAARQAIVKSAKSFGYGDGACMFATLFPTHSHSEGEGVAIDAQALFMLVESLDPLCLVCADDVTCALVGRAYRADCEPDTATRVFGRPAAAFRDFASLLATDDGKQRAWRLLKTLPKR